MARQDPSPRNGIESWSKPLAAVERWLKSSRTGDQLVYAHGINLLDLELGQEMRRLHEAGEVRLRQRRTDDGGIDFYVIRNRVRVQLPPRPRRQAGPVMDPAMSAVFLRLKAEARQGLRCSSDKVLGETLGLTADQVKWAIRKLVAAELIRTRLVPTRCEPKYRVVSIVATGLETALPGEERR